jgi:hypothetical protein
MVLSDDRRSHQRTSVDASGNLFLATNGGGLPADYGVVLEIVP